MQVINDSKVPANPPDLLEGSLHGLAWLPVVIANGRHTPFDYTSPPLLSSTAVNCIVHQTSLDYFGLQLTVHITYTFTSPPFSTAIHCIV